MPLCEQTLRTCHLTFECSVPCSQMRFKSSRLQRRHTSWHYTASQSCNKRRHSHTNAFQWDHRRRSRGTRKVTTCSLSDTLVGVGLFFTPSLLALAYATVKGKGNTKDGLSRMLTELSQGYFQPDVGGESIPVAQGELSDLAGDEPLFKALYQW